MSGDASQRLFNTQERATSSDINRTRNILQFNIQELMAAMSFQDTIGAGVINGLTITITNLGAGVEQVTVQSGYAFIPDSGISYPDSQNRLIELISPTVVSIAGQDDPANPRWLVIEIAPGITAPVQESVDIFNPTTNTFASATRDKEIRPEPVITVRAGTAAGVPAFPAGITGVLPLAYIFVPTTFTGFAAGHIISCRPLAGPVLPRPAQFGDAFKSLPVQGGGVSVAGVSTTLAELQPMSGQFLAHRDAFAFNSDTVVDLTDVAGRDGLTLGSLPIGDDVIYWYATQAPYPAGYDVLAEREFDVGTDAVSEVPGLGTGQSGCIVLASLTEPDRTTAQGSPIADLRNDAALFGGAQTIIKEDCFYIGATDFRGTSQFLTRQFGRAARVIPGADDRQSRIDISSTGTKNLWVPAGAADGFAMRLPITAFEIFVEVTAEVDDTTPDSVRYTFDDSSNRDALVKLDHQQGITTAHEVSHQLAIYPSSSGDVSLTTRDIVGSPGNEILYNRSYTDLILLRR